MISFQLSFFTCSVMLPVILLQLAPIVFCTPLEILPSLPYNFTLAAVNRTLPNANLTGAPLVLGSGGATTGLEFYVTSTYFSYPYNDYPALGLVNGNLRAFTTSGEWITNASAPSSGDTLGWVSSRLYTSAAPISFSAVRISEVFENPVLAVYGIADSWHLCPPDEGLLRGQNSVVFNRTAAIVEGEKLFNPVLCYPVFLSILRIG